MKFLKQNIAQLQTGEAEVEIVLMALLIGFAVLISGYFSTFNSSTSVNTPAPTNTEWVYDVLPTPILAKDQTIQQSDIYYISIPRSVYSLTGAPGGGPHFFGFKPNVRYYNPLDYQSTHVYPSFTTSSTSLTDLIVKKAYAAPPVVAGSLSSFLPPVGDQGTFNASSSWTTDYYMYGVYAKKSNFYPIPGGQNPPTGAGNLLGGFAPMFTYSQLCNNPNCTTGFAENLAILKSQGVDRRDDYVQGDYSVIKPTAPEQTVAGNYKLAGFTPVFSQGPYTDTIRQQAVITDIQTSLALGDPVALGIYVLDGLNKANATSPNFLVDNITPRIKDQQGNTAMHSVMAFAYDKNGVWVQNQWGTTWGLNGTAELSWKYIVNQTIEAYTESPALVANITPPPPDECATLNVNINPAQCGLNANQIGLFCGGVCGISGNPNMLYECQGNHKIAQTFCSPRCITCPGANRADECGTNGTVCGQPIPPAPITPGPGTQCVEANGSCTNTFTCNRTCTFCAVNNDCTTGNSCCH